MLVVGFVAGGTDDVDANLETVRLLRSQLRTKSNLKVIEADVMSLLEVAPPARPPPGVDDKPAVDASIPRRCPRTSATRRTSRPTSYLFENPDYWKKIGDEFQAPLIVTGTVLFTPYARSGFVQRENEAVDAYGRRTVEPTRTYMERKGYILRPKFVFIDGRTGAVLHTESLPGGSAVQPESGDAGVVVLLRVDGPPDPRVPQHAEQPEDPRHARPAAVGRGGAAFRLPNPAV